jgi:hypothetical protein
MPRLVSWTANRTLRGHAKVITCPRSRSQLKAHSNDFLQAYNFARRLKPLKGLNLYEYLWKLRTQSLDRFTLNPIHQILGLDI